MDAPKSPTDRTKERLRNGRSVWIATCETRTLFAAVAGMTSGYREQSTHSRTIEFVGQQ